MDDEMNQVLQFSSDVAVSDVNTHKFSFCTCFTSVFFLVAVVGTIRAVKRSHKKFPPGPLGWPIVGALYSLGPRAIPSFRRFATLAEKFGPIMFLRMGSCPTLVVSNAEMAMALLRTHDQKFASRPQLATGKHFGYNYSSVVFCPSGPHHRRMKKIYTTELLSPTKVELSHCTRRVEVQALLRCVLKSSKDAGTDGHATSGVNVMPMVFDYNLNIMGSMVLGRKQLFAEADTGSPKVPMEAEDFKSFLIAAARLVGLFNIGDYIPALRWLDLQGVERTLQSLKPHQEGLILPLIQEHRKLSHSREGSMKEKEGGHVAFIATLVAGYAELSDETITAVAIDVLVGGSSSVSSAIDWTLAELLRHPHYLEQAQEELDSVVGRDRLVEESDLPNLQFLNSVLKESLRLHPPVPLGIPHYSVEECIIAGYTIPANTTAYVNIWAIGRDPSMWKNPTEFHPERFMDSKVNFYGQDFQFLPFSSGRRGCPGVHVALANLKLMLANLLHCFTWESAPCLKGQEIDIGEIDGSTCSRLEPLLVSLQPRVPENVILRSYEPPPLLPYLQNKRE